MREKNYQIGEAKLTEELDVVKILKKLRKLDLIAATTLNQWQRVMLNFQ